jgi:hypothetical protein
MKNYINISRMQDILCLLSLATKELGALVEYIKHIQEDGTPIDQQATSMR